MKRTLEVVVAALLIAGFSTGCKGEKAEEAGDTTATAETTMNETTAEATETTEEADAAVAEAPAVDEPLYIKAAYEVTCVKAKIEDPEKQTAILAEVYPRYGFENAEAFATAETAMKDSESVKMALEEKMKACTVEIAQGFETAGAAEAGETAEVKADAPKKPSLSYKPGAYSGSVGGGGITDGEITVSARPDGQATGKFNGKREGKAFFIALKGEIGNDGKFRLKGGKGKNTAMVTGTLKGDKANGKIDGIINSNKYSVAFSAK